MLTLEFLKFSGIIPNDWELTRQPVINQRAASFAFNSGVTIAAQPGTVTFSEALGTDPNKLLDRCPLNVSVVEVRLQRQDQPAIPGLLFSGAFNYGVTGGNESERSQKLLERIDSWKADLETFRELVNQHFLKATESDSIFPSQVIQP